MERAHLLYLLEADAEQSAAVYPSIVQTLAGAPVLTISTDVIIDPQS